MTYTEELTEILGRLKNQDLKKQEGREAKQNKWQPKVNYTTKAPETTTNCHHRTLVLWFGPWQLLCLDTVSGHWGGTGPTITALGSCSPSDAVNTRRTLHSMCFLPPLLRLTGITGIKYPLLAKKGGVGRVTMTRGRFSRFTGRCWPQKVVSDAGQQKINRGSIYTPAPCAIQHSPKEKYSFCPFKKCCSQYLKRWFPVF